MPRYRFATKHIMPVPGKPHHFTPTSFDEEGADVEEAYAKAEPKFPTGFGLFCWFTLPETHKEPAQDLPKDSQPPSEE